MDIHDLTISFTCDCGHQFAETVARVEEQGGVKCPDCGHFEAAGKDFAQNLLADLTASSAPKIKNVGKLIGQTLNQRGKGLKR